MARDEQSETSGHNSRDLIRNYVERIENLNAEIEQFRQEYLESAKPIREEITSVLDEAEEHGVDKGVLRKVIRVRQMERRAEAVRDKLESYEQQSFDQMRIALGDLADTPLGQVTLARHPDAPRPSA